MIRDALKAAQIAAMKAGDKPRTLALRLVSARIKDREIELRTSGGVTDDDAMIVEVLQKMVKQRRESITMFEQGGRAEKAADEAAEIAVIEEFLPEQMDEAATNAAIDAIKGELGATSLKDMGRVIATLKARHGSQLDMGRASALVKAALSG
ncbi:MAG: GatB/YqeY domain-containing protein [Sphingomonadaceae bacterium]|nr:GatB/YqeY domain-containing protein [Sphingomonadaceae bacterium]